MFLTFRYNITASNISIRLTKPIQDVGERLGGVQKALGETELYLARALDTCVHAEKIRELVVNEKSSLRELTIAVLMTHWDFIAPVFFYRYSTLYLMLWQMILGATH